MATASWTAHPAELLRTGPGFNLAVMDRRATPGWDAGKKKAKAFTAARGELLSELQERLFAHGRSGGDRSVLLIIQGLDTAGKGGIVRHVIGMVDPQGVALRAFGVPTAEEKRHHYLWRVRRALPRPGYIGVFDRSHYEDVLVARIDGLVPHEVWEPRFAEINRFEEKITAAGTTVVKVALMPSYEEQGLRLMERLDRRDKYWKYDPADVDARGRWEEYQAAYDDVLARTSTPDAPWYVIPADRKWYARLAVTELLTDALLGLDLGWPPADFDVARERKRLAATMAPGTRAEAKAARKGIKDKVAKSEAEFARAVAAVERPDRTGLSRDPDRTD